MREVDPLEDFERRRFTADGLTRTVLVTAGDGPAVVVMPEMPGITPQVARFARWVRDAGFRVWVPSLFGADGVDPTAEEGERVMRRACVSAEFRAFAGGGTSPVTSWLRQLAAVADAEQGGRGVGVVGMCFTGNFALTTALEPSVVAPVLSQPALPLDAPGELELSPEDAEALRERFDRDDLRALGLRFDSDPWCTAERFAAYGDLLGERFCPRVLPGSSAHPDPPDFAREVVGAPHSVLTAHLVDEEGHPTVQARDEVIAFLRSRLLASPTLPGMDELLRRQWDVLRAWLDEVDVLDHRDRPSGLDGWTVGDLVAHLGYGITMVGDVRPAPSETEPMSLAAYVAHYPPAADVIADQTRERALATEEDLLGGVDAAAARAWAALPGLDSDVVWGRRGPITRDDYLLTRLIELVVHADDLHRAVPEGEHPGDPAAVEAVAAALAQAYTEVTARPPDEAAGYPWIRSATGRTESPDPALPLL